MKILNLIVNDVKRVSAIEINPTTGEPIILTGDNANGKSSVLDALELALSNKGLEDPIRHGRPSGNVKVVLGSDKVEYTLERRLTKSGDTLTLLDAQGNKMSKAQTFLNGLLGNYAFDPLEFTKLKPKEQVEALKKAAKLNFTELDSKREKAYARRTEVTRDGKEAKARFDAMTEPREGLPTEEVSAAELMQNLRELEKRVGEKQRASEELAAFEVQSAFCESAVARLRSELEAAEKHAAEKTQVVRDASAALAALIIPTPEELAAASEAVAQVDKTNAEIRAALLHKETSARLTALRLDLANLTREIEVVDETKLEMVKNADLPLEGLELTDDGILFNGTFFNQLSTAEQIRISTLVAMAQNPELRIVLIREGALMNKANLGMMVDLAKEKDYQLWIEKFQEDPGTEGFHIVDGSVAFVNGQGVEK